MPSSKCAKNSISAQFFKFIVDKLWAKRKYFETATFFFIGCKKYKYFFRLYHFHFTNSPTYFIDANFYCIRGGRESIYLALFGNKSNGIWFLQCDWIRYVLSFNDENVRIKYTPHFQKAKGIHCPVRANRTMNLNS